MQMLSLLVWFSIKYAADNAALPQLSVKPTPLSNIRIFVCWEEKLFAKQLTLTPSMNGGQVCKALPSCFRGNALSSFSGTKMIKCGFPTSMW